MGKFIDLTGQRFGRLIVIGRVGISSGKKVLWKCKCDCGNTKVVHGSALKNGDTRSCGCLNKEISGKRFADYQKEHGSDGRSSTRLYRIWIGMRNRCNNPNNYDFANYGGRGIKVCPEWNNFYEAFYSWAIENGYMDGLSIDRIDTDGDYFPENCRWVDMKTQHRNQRVSRLITFRGHTQTLADWSEKTGISHSALSARLRSGWTVERTLTEPLQAHKKKNDN